MFRGARSLDFKTNDDFSVEGSAQCRSSSSSCSIQQSTQASLVPKPHFTSCDTMTSLFGAIASTIPHLCGQVAGSITRSGIPAGHCRRHVGNLNSMQDAHEELGDWCIEVFRHDRC